MTTDLRELAKELSDHAHVLQMISDAMEPVFTGTKHMHGKSVKLLTEAAAALQATASASEGWQLVPKEPNEMQWGGLARDLIMWSRFQKHAGCDLYGHLRSLGRIIPNWLLKEIPDTSQVPPKGTVAACIYKAMLADAPNAPTTPTASGKVGDENITDLIARLENAAASWRRTDYMIAREVLTEAALLDEAASTIRHLSTPAPDRNAVIEECVRAIEPKRERPCDCDRCDCGNQGDAESVAAWDADAYATKTLRALKSATPTQPGSSEGNLNGI